MRILSLTVDRRYGFVHAIALTLLFGLTLSARAGDTATVAPISPALCDEMRAHNVMRPESPLSCARLSLVSFPYFGFDGKVHSDGRIVVMDAAAEYVLQIFAKLHEMRFPIAHARLMDHYEGNDSASTADNNTSSYNARKSTGGNSLSMHAYGLAIDLNPVQNPYVTSSGSGLRVMPRSAAEYANRSNRRPGMAESVIDVFADQGFMEWGGNWHNPIDYQHFQVKRSMSERLAALSAAQAKAVFKQYVEQYRACRKNSAPDSSRSKCI
jgi:D-alanyl-D-alanine carboxypeptidase-like protein